MEKVLVVATLLASTVVGQDPVELLRQPAPEKRAWGAHLAARTGNEALTPKLLRALVELRTQKGTEAELARRAIAGALVDLEARLPEPELRTMLAEFPVEALLLATHDPKQNAGLLRELVGQHESSGVRTAAANLLMRMDKPGVATLLSADTTLLVTIKVDEGLLASPVVFTDFGDGGTERIKVPEGFPEIAVRDFCFAPTPALASKYPVKVLVDGPVPVHFETQVVQPGSMFALGSRGAPTSAHWRIRYLEALAHVSGLSGLFFTGINVTWRDSDQYLESVAANRKMIESKWRRITRALVKRKLVEETTADRLEPRVQFRVEDHRGAFFEIPGERRGDKWPALPRVPGQVK